MAFAIVQASERHGSRIWVGGIEYFSPFPERLVSFNRNWLSEFLVRNPPPCWLLGRILWWGGGAVSQGRGSLCKDQVHRGAMRMSPHTLGMSSLPLVTCLLLPMSNVDKLIMIILIGSLDIFNVGSKGAWGGGWLLWGGSNLEGKTYQGISKLPLPDTTLLSFSL